MLVQGAVGAVSAGIHADGGGVGPVMLRLLLILALLLPAPPGRAADGAGLPWQPFGPALFAQAREQRKPVFLYLEAVWCHWCHVMQRQTFPDAGVQERLRGQWLLARVDHDADPLLANRYRNYGWPALIFFDAEGREVAKRAGFLSAADFGALLDAIVADPTPEQPAEGDPAPAPLIADLPDDTRARLLSNHRAAHDRRRGGLKLAQKYIDRDSVEYALSLAAAGDRAQSRRARQTLDAARALIDPVWGGMYQYSTHGDWAHPHYEKIMRSQAGALRSYALAYARWQRPVDAAAARAVRDYLLRFLRDPGSGAFYVSQDADLVPGQKSAGYFALDDAGRRRLGEPRVDRNRYAQENGLAIEALLQWHAASGDGAAFAAARMAADWALRERGLPDGRFRHGEADDGRYLGDSLQMARALLALLRAGGEDRHLVAAEAAARAIARHFAAAEGGYLTAVAEGAVLPPPRATEENIALARLYAALARATGKAEYLADGRHALRWLAQEAVAFETLTEPGILLAADELKAAEAALSISR